MKTTILFLLLTINLPAQEWINQNPMFSGWSVTDILFIDDQTGFVIMGSELYKTNDGGVTITKIYDNDSTYRAFTGIYYFNNLLLLVAVDKIHKSTDQGESFTSFPIPFLGISPRFLNADTGWIKIQNSHLKRTTDGGLTWADLYIPWGSQDYIFVDAQTGFATPERYDDRTWLFKTTDGGSSWSRINIGSDIQRNKISFFNNGTGYVHGKGFTYSENYLYSTDWGITWEIKDYILNGNIMVPAVITQNQYGYSGYKFNGIEYLYITSDYGASWTRQIDRPRIISVGFRNDSNFLAGGNYGQLHRTSDGGESWISITRPIFDNFSAFFLDENNGWISARYNLMKTTNGGLNWDPIYTGIEYLRPICFLNQDYGFAGNFIGTSFGRFMRTTDGGVTWDSLHSFPDNAWSIQQIYFKDSLNGFAVGRPNFFRTSNGGNTWDFSNPDSISGDDIYFPTPTTGYIVGYSGGYKSNDGGNTWIPMSSLKGETVFFIDSLTGWKGWEWELSKTTDGGVTFFDLIDHGQSDEFPSILFFNHNDGVVQFEGHNSIIQTTDGGSTWSTIFQSSNYGIPWYFNSCFVSPGALWVYSDAGIIYRYNGIVPVELTGFSTSVDGGQVLLQWTTASEKNNQGFEIQRKAKGNWEKIGYVQGFGATTESKTYSFTDKITESGKYSYRLKQIDFDGTYSYSNIIELDIDFAPGEYNLSQNYPNPFNPTTAITYSIPVYSNVVIKIFDILGKEIETLVNEEKPIGSYEVTWYAEQLPSGVYFYQLRAGSYIDTKKMILMK